MIKHLYNKTLPTLLILSICLSPLSSVLAAPDTGVRESEQALQDVRQADKDRAECEAEEMGFGGLGGLGGQLPNSLANTIGRGLQQQLGQTLSQTLSQNLNSILERQLTQNLPRFIEQELSQELPAILHNELAGLSADDARAQGPGILQAAIQNILPNIIQRGFPSVLQNGLSRELKLSLASQLQSQVPQVLNNDPYFQTNSRDMIHGLVDQTNSGILSDGDLLSVVGGLFGFGNTTFVSSQQRDQILQNVRSGIANDAANGLINSPEIDRLVRQMLPVIMKIVMGGIGGSNYGGMMGSLDSIMGGLGNNSGFSATANSFDFTQFAGNNITEAIGFDLRPVSESIAQPLALATVSGLGIGGYDNAIGNLSMIGYNGPINVSVLQNIGGTPLSAGGALYLNSVNYNGAFNSNIINQANAGQLAGFPSALESIDPTIQGLAFSETGAPELNTLGGAAASNINNGQIGLNAANSSLGSQVGTGLAQGFANGLSSLTGNLVDGIPFVGGLLSPLVEELVQVSLNEAFGLAGVTGGTPIGEAVAGQARAEAGGGFIVHDPGLPGVAQTGKATTMAVEGGFSELNPTAAKIQSNTKQVAETTQPKIIENQGRQESVAVKDCMQNKATKRATLAQETLKYVYDPGASMGAMILIARVMKNFQQWKLNAALDPIDPNSEGQSVIADVTQDQKNASNIGLSKTINAASKSQDPQDQEIARTIEKLKQQNTLPAATMSLEERQRFTQNATELDNQTFLEQFAKFHGHNDPQTRFLVIAEDALSRASAERKQAAIKSAAGGGFRGIEECVRWSDSPLIEPAICLETRVKTAPSTIGLRNNILSISDILRGVFADGFKEDSFGVLGAEAEKLVGNNSISGEEINTELENPCPGIEPCNPGRQYQQIGYDTGAGTGGMFDQLSFSGNFSTSLNSVLNNSLNNLSNQTVNWTESQINNFSGYIDSGIRGAGFTQNLSPFNYDDQDRMTDVVLGAFSGIGVDPGGTGFNQMVEEIVIFLLQNLSNGTIF